MTYWYRMNVYIWILIAILVYCSIKPIRTIYQNGGAGEIDFRQCSGKYKVTIPPYVQREDPLIKDDQNPWAKASMSHCRSDQQCLSGKCDNYFCT